MQAWYGPDWQQHPFNLTTVAQSTLKIERIVEFPLTGFRRAFTVKLVKRNKFPAKSTPRKQEIYLPWKGEHLICQTQKIMPSTTVQDLLYIADKNRSKSLKSLPYIDYSEEGQANRTTI